MPMSKITDPAYRLPEVIPLQWVRTFSSGANQPVVVQGISPAHGQQETYVLKYRGAERMDVPACRRELLASWLASEMDICVPEPVVIRTDAGFADLLPPDIKKAAVAHSEGLHFGCRYIEGITVLEHGNPLPPELIQAAARVFVFDLLIHNSDRRAAKPNAFLAEEKIYVIDHELAFGFLSVLPMFANPQPWLLNDTDVRAAREHLFFPLLRHNKNVHWDAASGAMQHLTPHFWQRVRDLLPEDWQDSEELTRIQRHVESIQQHSSIFIDEIWNKLIG